jgi:hypothetical protein
MPLPSPPIGLTSKCNSLGQLVISFFPSTGAISYNIYSRTDALGSFGAPLNSTPITSLSYIDTAFNNSITTYYNITTVNASGESFPSQTLTVTTISDGPVLPRVDIHNSKFERLISEKGYRLQLEKALACGCNKTETKTTDATSLNCPLCKNKYYIYFPATQIQAIITSMNQDSNLENSGQWLQGMYTVMVKPEDQLGLYDRLTFLDDSVSFTEALIRANTGNTDVPKFPILSFDLPIEDVNGILYVMGTDFTIDANGSIVWGLSSKQPSAGTPYGYRSQILRRLLICDFPHVQRATFTVIDGVNTFVPLCLLALGKLEMFFN